jgi:gliding motility-associated-like protein
MPLINGLKPRYCIGENIILNTPSQTNATYSWTGPNGFTSTLQEINILVDQANKAGIYTLSVTINGCTSDIKSVTVPPIGQTPIASFKSTSTNPCTPQQTFTFTNSSQNYTKLRWNFGEGASILPGNSNPINTLTYSSSGVKTIILEAEGSSGCISIFSQDLIVALSPERPILMVNKPDFCLTDTIRLSTPSQTDVVYSWTGPNNFTSNQRTPQVIVTGPLVAGTYSLTISRGNCSTETVSVVVPPIYQNPTAAFRAEPGLPSRLSIPIRVRFFNESKDADAYLWDFGDGNTSTDTNPEHTYTRVGNFDVSLTVFKSSVCSASIVKGQFIISADNILFVPNTFTPNNDAVNDEFVISMTNIKTYRIQIFNRFGVPLFLSYNIFDHWKGFYNNEILPIGTYYYVIDATDFNSNVIKKSGSVTLIK